MFKSLTQRFHTKSNRQTLRRPANDRKSPPRLELLEERLAPATRIWDGGSLVDSNWTTAANWVGDGAPVPGADELVFPSVAARRTNTNNFSGTTFRGLAFTGSNYSLGGNPLILAGNLTASPGTASNSVNLNLVLDNNRTFQVAAGSVLTINGAIIGGGTVAFTKTGTGTLVLRAANPYAGITQVNDGRIQVEHPSALGATGAGTIIAKGASLRLINIPSPVVFPPEPLTFGPGPGPRATLINSISEATWTGPVTFDPGANDLVAEPTRTLRFTGAISGAGGFQHVSAGVLEFAGTAPNTYTGVTQIARGTLRLNKPDGVNAIPGDLNIGTADANAGVVTLMKHRQIADSAAVTFAGWMAP